MSAPVRLSRLPDGAKPGRQSKPARTRAEMRADLECSIVAAASELERRLKTRALERMDQEAKVGVQRV